jgi:hypothetical protein
MKGFWAGQFCPGLGPPPRISKKSRKRSTSRVVELAGKGDIALSAQRLKVQS